MTHSGRFVRFKLRKSTQDRLLAARGIISDAAERVPFYHETFLRDGVKPSDLRSLEDLQRFPITDKKALLSCGQEGHLRAGAEKRTLIRRSTTGSHGTPTTVFANRSEALFRKATLLDSFRRLAKLPFPLTIADVGVEQGKIGTDIVQRMRLVKVARIFRATPLPGQVQRMRHLAPHLIEGRPSTLFALALEARRQNKSLPRPRLVASFGEVLHPHVRCLLEEAFGCRVVDYYNCEEVGNVAWECPLHPGWMHVNPATTVLEVVDDNGQPSPHGKIGRILLTNLYNRTMPFIRYDIGDRAATLDFNVCDCGFSGSSIRLVEGRDDDFFCLPDGRQISPRNAYETFAGVLPFKDLGNDLYQVIQGFQIIQETLELVTINVIPGPDYTDDVWCCANGDIRTPHPQMRVRIRMVEELEYSPGGKLKITMSRVDSSPGSRMNH